MLGGKSWYVPLGFEVNCFWVALYIQSISGATGIASANEGGDAHEKVVGPIRWARPMLAAVRRYQ